MDARAGLRRQLAALSRGAVESVELFKRARPPVELHRIPYGLAILVGAAWAAAANYFPVLRLP